jgi:hypothetical protein
MCTKWIRKIITNISCNGPVCIVIQSQLGEKKLSLVTGNLAASMSDGGKRVRISKSGMQRGVAIFALLLS